jgi:magnesium-transporting ATPase (P-type)
MTTNEKIEFFWSVPLGELYERLSTNLDGLTTSEAKRRARVYGPNSLTASEGTDALALLIAQSLPAV